MWANWVGAFGVLIEFFGFATLAYELMQTNKSAVTENLDLASESSAFDTIIVGQSSSIEGGLIGRLIANIKSREEEMLKRTVLIVRGVVITAVGAALQVIGSFGQALQ